MAYLSIGFLFVHVIIDESYSINAKFLDQCNKFFTSTRGTEMNSYLLLFKTIVSGILLSLKANKMDNEASLFPLECIKSSRRCTYCMILGSISQGDQQFCDVLLRKSRFEAGNNQCFTSSKTSVFYLSRKSSKKLW